MDKSFIKPFFWCAAENKVEIRNKITEALKKIDPLVEPAHIGAAEPSGCVWRLYVDQRGRGLGPCTGAWPVGTSSCWEVAASYRGPFITALSWINPAGQADHLVDAPLVALVNKIAEELDLFYLDAHLLGEWVIPWDEMKNQAEARFDWSTTPTAFSLLFYEY